MMLGRTTIRKNHIRACATADDISAVSRGWTPGVSMKEMTKAKTKPNLEGNTPIKTEAKVTVLSVVKGKQPQNPPGTKPSFVGRTFYIKSVLWAVPATTPAGSSSCWEPPCRWHDHLSNIRPHLILHPRARGDHPPCVTFVQGVGKNVCVMLHATTRPKST
jgi:hypothetical protein